MRKESVANVHYWTKRNHREKVLFQKKFLYISQQIILPRQSLRNWLRNYVVLAKLPRVLLLKHPIT